MSIVGFSHLGPLNKYTALKVIKAYCKVNPTFAAAPEARICFNQTLSDALWNY